LGTKLPTKNKSKKSRNNEIKVNGVLICERCGSPINFVVKRKRGNRYYYYGVHIFKDEDGKRHRVEHYLGPTDKYIHAETINPIGLTNAKEQNRFEEYVEKILSNLLIKDHFDLTKALQLINELKELINEKVTDKEERKEVIDLLSKWIEQLKSES